MRFLSILSAIALSIHLFSVSDANAGKVYRGSWEGTAKTSLEILSEKPLSVRYCFRGDCQLHEPSGSVRRMTIKYPRRGDFRGATLKFTKKGDRYEGWYKRRFETRVYKATLK